MITAYPYGYLHSNGNNCTGKSQGLFAYRTSKGVMLIKSTDALIHFGYTRYFHYYRIRKLLRNHLFYLCSNLCECFEFVGKGIKETFSKKHRLGFQSVLLHLNGFDKVFGIFFPHIWTKSSFFRIKNLLIKTDRASIFNCIRVFI